VYNHWYRIVYIIIRIKEVGKMKKAIILSLICAVSDLIVLPLIYSSGFSVPTPQKDRQLVDWCLSLWWGWLLGGQYCLPS